ncbi:hypothetical protein JCM9140_1228 [Halalkalibacter wakoensis JCM 9140]|uniref:Uncharacterized protein n=1 Tax=Halalkalibacter wakoensis JCM 9140 TaxID=1236970 RepID=W4PZH7_9BACI|nr:hypothetical protein [Halalkalibacter wakoensis]GAE25246.1 hypothetical protein JCM9140_1228 [Halalkalibacter wakoensis JCM 9140]
MDQNSNHNKTYQTSSDSVQPENAEHLDVITLGDMSLEKAERLHGKKPRSGTN